MKPSPERITICPWWCGKELKMARNGHAGDAQTLLGLPYIRTVVVLVLLACILYAGLPFIVALGDFGPRIDEADSRFLQEVLNQYSAFGQMFGFIGALFSGFALVGVVYA